MACRHLARLDARGLGELRRQQSRSERARRLAILAQNRQVHMVGARFVKPFSTRDDVRGAAPGNQRIHEVIAEGFDIAIRKALPQQ